MAVATLGTPTSDDGNGATASVAHTIGSGTGVVSYISVMRSGAASISSMSNFGGVAPQLVGTNDRLSVYRVISPSAGGATAQANLSAGVDWSIHVHTFQGVDTADPDDAVVTNTNEEGTDLLITVSSAAGDMVIAFGVLISDAIAAAGGATLSTEQESVAGSFQSTAVVYEAGAASVEFGVTNAATFGDNFIVGFNVNAAAAAGGGVPRFMNVYSRRRRAA